MKTGTEILKRLDAGMDRVQMRAELRGIIKMSFKMGFEASQRGLTKEKYHEGQIDSLLDSVVPPVS